MKHVIIVGDGMADEAIPMLLNRTPLQVARTPHMDRIARAGRVELLQTSYPGLPVGSIVANMAILGYDPRRYYPAGRASFEALAHQIELDDNDLAFRCNLIHVDSEGRISDFTAGQIPSETAKHMIAGIIRPQDMELYPGISYRNLLVWRGMGCDPEEIKVHPPHENIGRHYREILPRGRSERAEACMSVLRNFLESSKHELATRQKPATMLWPWSASRRPSLPSFTDRWGLKAGLVCGMDFLNGIAISAGIEAHPVPGATAYIDTNYAAKRQRAINYIERFDFVLVHINAPDEESHQGNLLGKIRSIELIDQQIVGPILDHLQQYHGDAYRIAVLPDHYTRLRDRQHGREPVPVAVSGSDIDVQGRSSYCEGAAEGAVTQAHEWLGRLMARDMAEHGNPLASRLASAFV
jgi:2,3-bisphosphoglycerate-independent phosphoglycerate mutase